MKQVVKFKGAAGRAIFNAVFTRSKPRANDLFLPGRTAFVFALEDSYSPDIPTTLRRSKADCPEVLYLADPQRNQLFWLILKMGIVSFILPEMHG